MGTNHPIHYFLTINLQWRSRFAVWKRRHHGGRAQQLSPLSAAVEEATLPEVDFHQELMSAGALIGMITGAFQPEEQERPTTLAEYLEALHRRDQSMLAWEQFFDEWDVLLCPPSMITAFPHCEPGTPLHVDGQEVVYWMVSA